MPPTLDVLVLLLIFELQEKLNSCVLNERANGVIGTACPTVGYARHSVGVNWLLLVPK